MQKDETAHKKKDKNDRRAEDDKMFLSIKMPSEGLWYEITWGSVTGFYNKF